MAYLSTWNVFDPRTLTLFGQRFTSWQVVPVIYILLSVVLAVVGKYIYQRYQVLEDNEIKYNVNYVDKNKQCCSALFYIFSNACIFYFSVI